MQFSRYRFFVMILALTLFQSCGKGPSEEDLKHLQGYWEIKQVVFPDGSSKQYEVNATVEYLEWDGAKGFRKKVQPTLEGTYLTSDDALPMQVVWKKGRLFLTFSGGEEVWEEEVLELSPGVLVTLHSNGLRYEYQRFEPMTNPENRA